MAEKIDAGIAYLMALKGSGVTQATAAAPAREATPGEQSNPTAENAVAQERYQGPEKRRSARYKCEGGAELREENCDVRTWATFTDISLHGCYVEAQATYPVGTVLQMKLEACGFKVQTKGNVRVNYPYLGMGISFVDMSEEDRAQLKEMLSRISRPAIMVMGPGIASSLPAGEPMSAVPLISDPGLAVQALLKFFEDRQMLMREDFLRIVRKSQPVATK